MDVDVKLRERSPGDWVCVFGGSICGLPDAPVFCGEGESMQEAVGAWVIANREALGFTFTSEEADGQKYQSTAYGKSRGKVSMGSE